MNIRTVLRGRDLGATVGVAAVLLAVISDYDLRQRDATAQIRGVSDWAVLLELGVYFLVGAWALRTIVARRGLSPRVSDSAVALFVAYSLLMTISTLWAPFPQLAFVRGGQLVVLALLAWLIASTPTARRSVLVASSAAAVVVTTLSIPFGFVFAQRADRFSWFLVHPILTALYLGISCIVITTVLSNNDRWSLSRTRRVWLTVLLAVHVFALFATVSRGPIVATASGVLVVLWVSYPRQRRAILLLGLAALSLVAWLAFEELLTKYFLRGQDIASFASLSGRTDLWAEAFRLFEVRPLVGHGFGATRGLFLETIGLGGAHNMVVELMINGGLVGMVIFVGLFGSIAIRLARWTRVRLDVLPRDELALAFGIVALLLVSGIAYESAAATINVLVIWLAVLAGWTASAQLTVDLSRRRASTSVGSLSR